MRSSGHPTGQKVKPNMADMGALSYVGFSPPAQFLLQCKYERPRRETKTDVCQGLHWPPYLASLGDRKISLQIYMELTGISFNRSRSSTNKNCTHPVIVKIYTKNILHGEISAESTQISSSTWVVQKILFTCMSPDCLKLKSHGCLLLTYQIVLKHTNILSNIKAYIYS